MVGRASLDLGAGTERDRVKEEEIMAVAVAEMGFFASTERTEGTSGSALLLVLLLTIPLPLSRVSKGGAQSV